MSAIEILLAASIVVNLLMFRRLASLRRRALSIVKRPETCTMIAEAVEFLGDLTGEPIRARDPIGFRRKVVIERDCSTEVYVEQSRPVPRRCPR